MSGSNGSEGAGLVEIYDLDGPAVSELGNIGTRGLVQPGEDALIGGIIVNGSDCTASTMVVRAIGPPLGGFGVADPLQDPTLELRDLSGVLLASNDNWKDTQQSELETAGLAAERRSRIRYRGRSGRRATPPSRAARARPAVSLWSKPTTRSRRGRREGEGLT